MSLKARALLSMLAFMAYYVVFGSLAIWLGLVKNGWAFMGIFLVGAVWTMIDRRLEKWQDSSPDIERVVVDQKES